MFNGAFWIWIPLRDRPGFPQSSKRPIKIYSPGKGRGGGLGKPGKPGKLGKLGKLGKPGHGRSGRLSPQIVRAFISFPAKGLPFLPFDLHENVGRVCVSERRIIKPPPWLYYIINVVRIILKCKTNKSRVVYFRGRANIWVVREGGRGFDFGFWINYVYNVLNTNELWKVLLSRISLCARRDWFSTHVCSRQIRKSSLRRRFNWI